MADSGRRFTGDPMFLADRLGLLALVLLVAFLLTILATILPLQLLDTSWQYRFTGSLTDNAPVAVLSFALLHLAIYLDPENLSLLSWRRRFGRFAILLTLLFLLLIPLQGWILWRGSTNAAQNQSQQRNLVNREITTLLETIQKARSKSELIANLPPSIGASLGPKAKDLSLDALRERLEGDAIRARNQLRQQIDSPALADSWTLWKRSLRVMLSALVYAVAFSAFALIPAAETPDVDFFELLQDNETNDEIENPPNTPDHWTRH